MDSDMIENRLTDRFGRRHTYLRISVTDRCNLRCLYCLPEERIDWKRREELLTFAEVERVARVAVEMGVEKIRVTGGEPFVRADVEELLAALKSIPGLRSLAVTTNAVLLAAKLPFVRSSVDAFNISLDTFRPERFRELTGRDRLADVLAGIDAVLEAGYTNLKINAVVMRGVNEDEILDFARFTQDRPVAVRFIEFMPFAGNEWSAGRLVTMAEILAAVEAEYRLEPIPEGPSPVSRDFRLTNRTTERRNAGSIGVIASMSRPFCASCSRLRLTAEGKVMPCLHSPLEFDLRGILRSGGSDGDIADLFLKALGEKPEEHLPAEGLLEQNGRVMIQIGG